MLMWHINVKLGERMEAHNQKYWEKTKLLEVSSLPMYEGRGLEMKLKRLLETDKKIDGGRNGNN